VHPPNGLPDAQAYHVAGPTTDYVRGFDEALMALGTVVTSRSLGASCGK
jgi:hypothetical protein